MSRGVLAGAVVFLALLAACSQTEPSPTSVPTSTAIPSLAAAQVPSTPTPTAVPTQIPPTATPTLVPTATPTLVPTATPTLVPTATPTLVPTATPTLVPTATPTLVPTATPTLVPTPTPAVSYTEVNSYGFELIVDGTVSVESLGLLQDEAREEDGIVLFEYEGAKSTLLWLGDTDLDELLFDTYNQIVEAQSDLAFALISERIIEENALPVGSSEGKTLTFVSTAASGDVAGGGITGVWKCTTGRVFSLTVTGSDPVVLQIRFKRLLDGFSCSL